MKFISSDFKIYAKNGTVETVRYLLYLTIDRIHNEVDNNPNIKSIIVEHRKESIEQVLVVFDHNLSIIKFT